LARLAARIRGVVVIEDNELSVDLEHLADVLSAVTPHIAARENYEYPHLPPQDDAYQAWRENGPRADDFTDGLSDFLVMSSGEIAAVRLLATLASTSSVPPFGVAHIRSLDEEGQRLVNDWCAVVRAHRGPRAPSAIPTMHRRVPAMSAPVSRRSPCKELIDSAVSCREKGCGQKHRDGRTRTGDNPLIDDRRPRQVRRGFSQLGARRRRSRTRPEELSPSPSRQTGGEHRTHRRGPAQT
jgi:hypothetical protein